MAVTTILSCTCACACACACACGNAMPWPMAPAEMWDTRTEVYSGCVMRMRVASTWHTVMPLRHVPASHTHTQHSPGDEYVDEADAKRVANGATIEPWRSRSEAEQANQARAKKRRTATKHTHQQSSAESLMHKRNSSRPGTASLPWSWPGGSSDPASWLSAPGKLTRLR